MADDIEMPDTPAPEPAAKRTILSGMFRNWYLEYASYVILEEPFPTSRTA